jgi:hypothetical protein
MSDLETSTPQPRRELSAAHAVVIILLVLTVIALILGIATGSVNEHFLQKPVPSNAITIP